MIYFITVLQNFFLLLTSLYIRKITKIELKRVKKLITLIEKLSKQQT